MPKFLMEAKFTAEGLDGVRREGGTLRREAVNKAVQSLGGHVESFNFAFGKYDTFTIVDLPDKESAAALSLSVSATGAAMTRMVPLLTPEEMDTVVHHPVDYTPPS